MIKSLWERFIEYVRAVSFTIVSTGAILYSYRDRKLDKVKKVGIADNETKERVLKFFETYEEYSIKVNDIRWLTSLIVLFLMFGLYLIYFLYASNQVLLNTFYYIFKNDWVAYWRDTIILFSSFPLLIGISILFFMLLRELTDNYILRKKPLDGFVYYLLSALSLLEEGKAAWKLLSNRKRLLFYIEKAAECAEFYLPLYLRSGDSATHLWLKDRMNQVANALREKKKWVLTPKVDTPDYLLKSILIDLTAIAEDNWDALEFLKSEEKIVRHRWLQTIYTSFLKVLKVIFVGAVPAVGFFIFQQTPFRLTGSNFIYGISILSLYELVIFTTAIDSNFFSSAISNVKDIRGILTPQEKNGK
jgi:hypothetical protein